MIRFSAPLFFLWVVPLLAVLLFRLRHLSRAYGRTQRRAVQALILLAALCASLALVGLEVGARLDRMATVFVLDRSRSAEGAEKDARAAIAEILRAMEPDDVGGLVVFGAEAKTAVLPSPRLPLGVTLPSVPRDATDMAAGIRRALSDLPAGYAGRVVLMSDGLETRGDAVAAAVAAGGRSVAVDVWPMQRKTTPEVAVVSVRLPQVARPDEPMELRIVTRSTVDTRARVRVLRDGVALAETETALERGHDVLVLRERGPPVGVHRYDVVVDPLDPGTDTSRSNNEGGAFLRVVGGSRALIVEGADGHGAPLETALADSGVDVTRVTPARVPASLAELSSFDLVALIDVNARYLRAEQMRDLRAYVADLGGGLLMAGTRDAFGLGGYAYTPVEEVLPATFDLRKRKDRLSLAMVIAIDKSGSMGEQVGPGVTKLDLANEAAALSAMLLAPSDRAGVMHVDTEVSWTLPLSPVNDPKKMAAVIRRAGPGGGGILVDITLAAAFEALGRESTQLRHLLLFSDGSDSEQMGGTRRQVAEALRGGVTTSVVSMGTGPDTPALEQLSRVGGGRFYIVEDLRELPRIFTQETVEASRAALVEEPFRAAAVAPDEITRGIDFGEAPPLGGYSVVNARPRASVLLAAKDEDPLLLAWHKGVGRSAVFATDVGARFARAWLSWSGHAALLSQLGRALARTEGRSDTRLHVDVTEGSGMVRVDAVDARGRYQNHLTLVARVAGPAGESLTVPLRQTAAGRYEGRFPADPPGAYLVSVDEEGAGLVASAGAVRARGDEISGEATNLGLLHRVAALSGGTVRTDLSGVFEDRPPPTWTYEPLFPYLVPASLILLLSSVAARRLVVSRAALGRLVPAVVRRRAARRASPTPSEPEETLAALSRARGARRPPRREGHEEPAPEVARVLDGPPDAPPEASAASPRAPSVRHPADPGQEAVEPSLTRPEKGPGGSLDRLLEKKRKKRR